MISTACRLNRPNLRRSGGTTVAAVTLDPGPVESPPPRHVALCVDASGSTDEETLSAARDGAARARGRLAPDDRIAVVAFGAEVRTLLAATRVADLESGEVARRLDDVSPDGGTRLHAGVERAARELRHLPDAGAAKRLVVLAGGRDGRHDPAAFERLGREADAAGVRVVAAGVGAAYDDRTLRALAGASRGEWRHLGTTEAVRDLCPDVVERAGRVVAPDARLDVTPASGASLDGAHRDAPAAAAVDAAQVPLPDLCAGERQRVFLRFRVSDGDAGEAPVATVTLRAEGASAEGRVAVRRTDDPDLLAAHDPRVTVGRLRAALRAALGAGDVERASDLFDRTAGAYGDDAVSGLRSTLDRVRAGDRAARAAAVRGVDA